MSMRIQEVSLHKTGIESIAFSGARLEACKYFKLFLQLVLHCAGFEYFFPVSGEIFNNSPCFLDHLGLVSVLFVYLMPVW